MAEKSGSYRKCDKLVQACLTKQLRRFTNLLERSGRCYHREEVPEPFHEKYIYSYYRHPRSSACECIASLLTKNNETVNCWSHAVAAVLFIALLLHLAPSLLQREHTAGLVCLCLGAIVYTVGSTSAHTFNTLSVFWRHCCFFVDYGAISVYAFSMALAYADYCLPREWNNPGYKQMYIAVAFVFATASTLLSSHSRFLSQTGECAIMRVMAFALPYIADSYPLYVRLFQSTNEIASNIGLQLHIAHIVLAIVSALIFGAHFPERFAPGKFDFLGHSHQLMHIVAVFGTSTQLGAAYSDWRHRRFDPETSSTYYIGLFFLFFIINVAIVTAYCYRAKTLLVFTTERLYCCEDDVYCIESDLKSDHLRIKGSDVKTAASAQREDKLSFEDIKLEIKVEEQDSLVKARSGRSGSHVRREVQLTDESRQSLL